MSKYHTYTHQLKLEATNQFLNTLAREKVFTTHHSTLNLFILLPVEQLTQNGNNHQQNAYNHQYICSIA